MAGVISKQIELSEAKTGVEEMHQYWRSKMRGDLFPTRGAIQPWEIQEKLGRVCLLEIQQDPVDFVYKLDGSNVASGVGEDMTGKPVSKVNPALYAEILIRDLTIAWKAAAPTLWEIDLDAPPAIYRYQRLILPLCGNDSDDLEYLMTFSFCLDTADGVFPWNRSYGKPE